MQPTKREAITEAMTRRASLRRRCKALEMIMYVAVEQLDLEKLIRACKLSQEMILEDTLLANRINIIQTQRPTTFEPGGISRKPINYDTLQYRITTQPMPTTPKH